MAESPEPVELRLDAELGPTLFARFREWPLAADPGVGSRAADIGGPEQLHLQALAGARRGNAVDLLRGWLSALSARDELWLLRMREQHALERALAASSDGQADTLAQEHAQARRREAQAVSTLVAQLSALQATTDDARRPRLPFIKPEDLLLTSTEAGASVGVSYVAHPERALALQRIASGMEAVDAARQLLLSFQQAPTGNRRIAVDVAAARAGLVAAWRDLYSASYELLLVQAEREARGDPAHDGWLKRWSSLFSDAPPRY